MVEIDFKQIFIKNIDPFIDEDFTFEKYENIKIKDYFDSIDIVHFQIDMEESLNIELSNSIFEKRHSMTFKELYDRIKNEIKDIKEEI